jgi:hypothetical protein
MSTKFTESPNAETNIVYEQKIEVTSNSMFSNFWNKNKKIIIIISVVIIVAILCYGGYRYYRHFKNTKEDLSNTKEITVDEVNEDKHPIVNKEDFNTESESEESNSGEETEEDQ